MDVKRLQGHQQWLKEELDRCVAFWLKNGMDPVHGGVYTCLDREGKVFSTDKSVWMQGRCGWIFAYLCHLYGRRDGGLGGSQSLLGLLGGDRVHLAPLHIWLWRRSVRLAY